MASFAALMFPYLAVFPPIPLCVFPRMRVLLPPLADLAENLATKAAAYWNSIWMFGGDRELYGFVWGGQEVQHSFQLSLLDGTTCKAE
jgi:hypothetical protein